MARLVPNPLSDILIVVGTSIAALGYGLVFLQWKEKRSLGSIKSKLSRSPQELDPSNSSRPTLSTLRSQHPVQPAGSATSQGATLSVQPASETSAIAKPSTRSEPPGNEGPSDTPPLSAPKMDLSNRQPDTSKSEPHSRMLPSIKAPKGGLPPIITAHLVPIALLGIGPRTREAG